MSSFTSDEEKTLQYILAVFIVVCLLLFYCVNEKPEFFEGMKGGKGKTKTVTSQGVKITLPGRKGRRRNKGLGRNSRRWQSPVFAPYGIAGGAYTRVLPVGASFGYYNPGLYQTPIIVSSNPYSLYHDDPYRAALEAAYHARNRTVF